jgi:hypothetical protein
MSYAPDGGYEATYAPSIPGNKGPLRFEEGVATDTDVPMEFGRGAYGDTAGSVALGTLAGMTKTPVETMRERAHVGSASWIEAPMQLQEFVQGASMDHPTFERVAGSESRIYRWNPTRVG